MDQRLYNKAVNCPVCAKEFETTKVKIKACKVLSRDSDFCVYYDEPNPMYYDIWVCESCGYAAQEDRFDNINEFEAGIIKSKVSSQWKKRSFSGERTIDAAIEAFKLALYELQLRNGKPSEMAKLCIRLAWLYRIKKDAKEIDFLKFAARNYQSTYETEDFPIEKLDEFTCLYMIGEVNRRIGNFSDSVKWFSKLIGSQEARKNQTLLEKARDQFQLAKEEMGKSETKDIV